MEVKTEPNETKGDASKAELKADDSKPSAGDVAGAMANAAAAFHEHHAKANQTVGKALMDAPHINLDHFDLRGVSSLLPSMPMLKAERAVQYQQNLDLWEKLYGPLVNADKGKCLCTGGTLPCCLGMVVYQSCSFAMLKLESSTSLTAHRQWEQMSMNLSVGSYIGFGVNAVDGSLDEAAVSRIGLRASSAGIVIPVAKCIWNPDSNSVDGETMKSMAADLIAATMQAEVPQGLAVIRNADESTFEKHQQLGLLRRMGIAAPRKVPLAAPAFPSDPSELFHPKRFTNAEERLLFLNRLEDNDVTMDTIRDTLIGSNGLEEAASLIITTAKIIKSGQIVSVRNKLNELMAAARNQLE